MTSNLPEVQSVTLGGQASLWADPRQLLAFDDASLRRLAAEVGHEAGGVLAQVRRAVGLVAWAAWYRMSEKDYRSFAEGLAGDLDIEVETLRNWRRAVVRTDKLPVPGVAALRAGESAKGRKTAGQPTGALSPTAPSGVIPAVSTEAPAKKSEGSGPGKPQTRPGVAAPSDPSPVGGNALGEVSAPPTVVPRPPTDRALTARVFAAMREVDPTDAGPVTTPEEATFLRQWAQRALDAWKAKNVPVAAPRPAGRVIKPAKRPPSVASVLSVGQGRGKRHADDCSCLSCALPKAATK